ncbi:hypothetical protein AMJ49_03090 [Parcubacteria bacterium DG_74_2]|nr:MAG: hypothetical protein AMJ49_03090 [Parcubacteria bacterium DG_74_2]
MENNLPFVSVIIPCRNEESFISKFLDSVISQDYPKERIEILVIDGMSEDRTREIVKGYIKKYPFIKILDNLNEFTPFGLNIGVKKSKGEIIIRMDAHATYKRDYVSKCIKYLKEYNTENIGGVIKTIPSKNTLTAKTVAFSLSHFFGAGTSYFRIGSKESREVDTVFGGCYKREIFEKIGLFNEKLIRSQDIEFNKRLRKTGGKILLFPEIIAYYYPQSTLFSFFRHNFLDGIWTTYPLKFGIKIFSLRHLIPLFFVLSSIFSLILSLFFKNFFFLFLFIVFNYLFLNFLFSFFISLREKDFRYFFLMPITFFLRHFGYGLGSIFGLFKILLK